MEMKGKKMPEDMIVRIVDDDALGPPVNPKTLRSSGLRAEAFGIAEEFLDSNRPERQPA